MYLNQMRQVFICVHLHCNVFCHLGQCKSFTMRQMLVCHLMDTFGTTVEQHLRRRGDEETEKL